MRIRSLLSAAAIVAVGVTPLAMGPVASAAGTVQLRVANFDTYSADSLNNPYTVCLDGSSVTSVGTGLTTGPFNIAPGAHALTLYAGLGQPCSGSPDLSENITIPTDPASTLVLWNDAVGDSDLAATVMTDDLSCLQPGQSRVITRNVATFYAEGAVPAIDYKNATTTFATNLAMGAQNTVGVPAGVYSNPNAYIRGTNVSVLNDSPLAATIGLVTVRTLFGGADGSAGSNTNVIEVPTCQTPTTSTTVAPTTMVAPTTTAAPNTMAVAATAVAATPTYTG